MPPGGREQVRARSAGDSSAPDLRRIDPGDYLLTTPTTANRFNESGDSTTLRGTTKPRFVVNPPRACGKGEWKTPYYHAFVVSCYEQISYTISPLTLHKPSHHLT